MALLNVPFLIVPVTGVGTGAGAGNGFSLILSCLATEVGTGSFLGDAGAAIAVCGREGGKIDFAGDLLTMVVFSLLVLLSEALLARAVRPLSAVGCGADATESSVVEVGAVAGRLAPRVLAACAICWVAVPRGLGSGGGDLADAGDFSGERGSVRELGDLGERTVGLRGWGLLERPGLGDEGMPVGAGLGLLRFFGLERAAEAGWAFSLSAVGTSSLEDSQYMYATQG